MTDTARNTSFTFTAAVPAKLQLDGWWLDSGTRPFPKQTTRVKLSQKETGE